MIREQDYDGDTMQYILDVAFIGISAWILIGSIITAIACALIWEEKDMKKKTQSERVLDYLRTHKYVTAIDGFTKFQPCITQIHTVVYRLRSDGYDIKSNIVKNKKTGERYSRWSLGE